MMLDLQAPLKVLLIDDDRDDYLITRDLLEELGQTNFSLSWSAEFGEGLTELQSSKYDVCLLDYRLGVSDGLELLERAQMSGCVTPFIFLTGRGDPYIERRALTAGAADYLVKAELDADRLARAIRHSIERSRTFAALRQREHQYRSLFDNALDAILLLDDDGNCIDANAAALDLFGMSRAVLTRGKLREYLKNPPDLDKSWCAFLASGRDGGTWDVRTPAGEVRSVEYRSTANIIQGRHLSVLRDVTERRRAADTHMRLAALLEATVDAITGVNLDGNIDYWSPSAERTYGYHSAEVLGRPLNLLFAPDRHAEVEELIRVMLRGETLQHFETNLLRKDGRELAASLSMSTVRRGAAIAGMSLVARDITHQRNMEAQLVLSDRMASIGVLAAGVGHEVNNPLTAVIATAEFMSEGVDELLTGVSAAPSVEACRCLVRSSVMGLKQHIKESLHAAGRIRRIVRDLKLFSRADEQQLGPVDIHTVIENSLGLAENDLRHRAMVVRDFATVPPVQGNEARLGQVFLNLFTNAAHALVDGDARRNELRISTRVSADGNVVAEVRDSGAGMSEEVRKRVFEPFFTTKPLGSGTGLGLAICKRIIDDLRGTIDVESTEAEGTLFRITLPPARSRSTRPAPSLPPVQPARARILVIDDDESVLAAIERTLRRDYDVWCCSKARDALTLVESAEHFALIVCDLMMPEMTGIDFHEQLKERHPSVADRVVFLTGGAFTTRAAAFMESLDARCMEKPYDASELRAFVSRHIRRILEANRTSTQQATRVATDPQRAGARAESSSAG